MDGSRADLDLHLSSLDQVHNTYQDALGLRLQSQDGAFVWWLVAEHRVQMQTQRTCQEEGQAAVQSVCWRVWHHRVQFSFNPTHVLPNRAGELYLEFTQISAAQPDKPYGFAVKVLDESHYEGATALAGGCAGSALL